MGWGDAQDLTDAFTVEPAGHLVPVLPPADRRLADTQDRSELRRLPAHGKGGRPLTTGLPSPRCFQLPRCTPDARSRNDSRLSLPVASGYQTKTDAKPKSGSSTPPRCFHRGHVNQRERHHAEVWPRPKPGPSAYSS